MYSVGDAEIIEHITDEVGWPNITDDGILMYDNEFTTDYEKAVKMAISETIGWIEMLERRIQELENELSGKTEQLKAKQDFLKKLQQ